MQTFVDFQIIPCALDKLQHRANAVGEMERCCRLIDPSKLNRKCSQSYYQQIGSALEEGKDILAAMTLSEQQDIDPSLRANYDQALPLYEQLRDFFVVRAQQRQSRLEIIKQICYILVSMGLVLLGYLMFRGKVVVDGQTVYANPSYRSGYTMWWVVMIALAGTMRKCNLGWRIVSASGMVVAIIIGAVSIMHGGVTVSVFSSLFAIGIYITVPRFFYRRENISLRTTVALVGIVALSLAGFALMNNGGLNMLGRSKWHALWITLLLLPTIDALIVLTYTCTKKEDRIEPSDSSGISIMEFTTWVWIILTGLAFFVVDIIWISRFEGFTAGKFFFYVLLLVFIAAISFGGIVLAVNVVEKDFDRQFERIKEGIVTKLQNSKEKSAAKKQAAQAGNGNVDGDNAQ